MPDRTPIALKDAVELLKTRGVDIQSGTLKKYASHTYQPHLKAFKSGKMWFTYTDDIIEWAGAYKQAPAIGRRLR